VARRWQVCSQQVFGWRRAACRAVTTVSTTTTARAPAPDFVPIMTDVSQAVSAQRVTAPSAAPAIEVKVAGAVVRVVSGMDDAAQLTAVLRAVRASASRT
jgi:transposase